MKAVPSGGRRKGEKEREKREWTRGEGRGERDQKERDNENLLRRKT